MRKPGIIIILAILACSIVVAGMTIPVFIIRDGKSAETIFLRAVKPGNTFLLKYLHSIALSDVWERFVIGPEQELVLTETRFKGQGAGLPTDLSGDEKLVRQDGWFIITGMNRKVPVLYWRVQIPWKNRFRFESEPEINLSRKIGDRLVLMEVQKMKLIKLAYFRLLTAIQHLKKARS